MHQDLPHIIPLPQPEVEETFSAYQTTHEFYHEVQGRLEFQRYCEWYYKTAELNRQELQKMRGELNIFRLFRRF
jgi:predicted secreted hydrolase